MSRPVGSRCVRPLSCPIWLLFSWSLALAMVKSMTGVATSAIVNNIPIWGGYPIPNAIGVKNTKPIVMKTPGRRWRKMDRDLVSWIIGVAHKDSHPFDHRPGSTLRRASTLLSITMGGRAAYLRLILLVLFPLFFSSVLRSTK